MHITSVLLKNYSFCKFLNRPNFATVFFFPKSIFLPQKMFMSYLCLCHDAYLKDASNMFLVVANGQSWDKSNISPKKFQKS